MKIIALRKKIIINSSAFAILLIALTVIALYNLSQKGGVDEKVNKIKAETSKIKIEAIQIQSKTSEAKKYKELWGNITENKKSVDGIKMDEVNAKLNSIAAKFNIEKPSIKVALPQTMKGGIYDRKTVNILFTTVNLTFEAYDDVRAMYFLDELFDELPGYVTITSLSIKKVRDYETSDYVAISTAKGVGAIQAEVNFYWYVYKSKETEKKEPEKKIENDKQNKPANVL